MLPPPVERSLAAFVLGSAAWPIIASSTSRQFRLAFPQSSVVLRAALAGHLCGVVIAAAWAPLWMLRALVVIGLAWLLGLHAYSAVARGRARGWPPGSLCPLRLGPWFDRDFFATEARQLGSPFKTAQFLRPMACFVGLSGGIDFMKQHEASLASPPLAFGRFIPGGFLRHMTPERHLATKNVFGAAFAREVFEPLVPFMRDQLRAELARMVLASDASGGAGVPPRRHIQRAVFAIWARLFFHVEPDSQELQRLKTAYRTIDIRNPSQSSDHRIRAALTDIHALLQSKVAQTADTQTPGSFLAALVRLRADALDDPTLIRNLIYTSHTTWSDISGLLQWVFHMLTEHGAWADRLRTEDGALGELGDTQRSLSTRIVSETLRLEQSEFLYRVATHDIAHDGFVIPRGWLLRLCVRESHRDPTVFSNPHTFDPDRFLNRTYTRREYSPFGAGLRHACLGEGLTKVVGSVFAEELARRHRWQTVTDGPPELSAWRHWRPNSAWRVVIAHSS